MEKIWDNIIELGNTDGGTVLHRVAKLSEESGELAAAILLKDGYKFNKYELTDVEIEDNILEEGADVLIVVLDLLNKAGFTKEEIKNRISDKMMSWANVIEQHTDDGYNIITLADKIIQNAVVCTKCGDTLISSHRHDYISCSCGNITIDGGVDYFKEIINDTTSYINLRLTDKSTTDEIDNALLWGVRIDGVVEYKLLRSLTKEHLENILRTQHQISDEYRESITRLLDRIYL